MKKEYSINVWQRSLNNGTSCLFRTTDKAEFYNAIKQIAVSTPAFKGLYRVTKYGDKIFVSFADNGDVFYFWKNEKVKGKVDSVEFCRLDTLFRIL